MCEIPVDLVTVVYSELCTSHQNRYAVNLYRVYIFEISPTLEIYADQLKSLSSFFLLLDQLKRRHECLEFHVAPYLRSYIYFIIKSSQLKSDYSCVDYLEFVWR